LSSDIEFWPPSLLIELLITGPVISHSRNKDGRHFYFISGPISYICPDAKLHHFIKKRVIKNILFMTKRSRLAVQISNGWLYYQRPVIEWSSGYGNPVIGQNGRSITELVRILDPHCSPVYRPVC
jgi:hypothetical protein